MALAAGHGPLDSSTYAGIAYSTGTTTAACWSMIQVGKVVELTVGFTTSATFSATPTAVITLASLVPHSGVCPPPVAATNTVVGSCLLNYSGGAAVNQAATTITNTTTAITVAIAATEAPTTTHSVVLKLSYMTA